MHSTLPYELVMRVYHDLDNYHTPNMENIVINFLFPYQSMKRHHLVHKLENEQNN